VYESLLVIIVVAISVVFVPHNSLDIKQNIIIIYFTVFIFYFYYIFELYFMLIQVCTFMKFDSDDIWEESWKKENGLWNSIMISLFSFIILFTFLYVNEEYNLLVVVVSAFKQFSLRCLYREYRTIYKNKIYYLVYYRLWFQTITFAVFRYLPFKRILNLKNYKKLWNV